MAATNLAYPLLCPRCHGVTIASAVENAGTPDKPLCIVCYFETIGEPADDDVDRMVSDRLWPEEEATP